MSANSIYYIGAFLVLFGTIAMWKSNKKASKEARDEQTSEILNGVANATGEQRERIIEALHLSGDEIITEINTAHTDTRNVVFDYFKEVAQPIQDGIDKSNERMGDVENRVSNIEKTQNAFDESKMVIDLEIYMDLDRQKSTKSTKLAFTPENIWITFKQGESEYICKFNSNISFINGSVFNIYDEVWIDDTEKHIVDDVEPRIIFNKGTLETVSRKGIIDVTKPFRYLIHEKIGMPNNLRKIELRMQNFKYDDANLNSEVLSVLNGVKSRMPYRNVEEIEANTIALGIIKP